MSVSTANTTKVYHDVANSILTSAKNKKGTSLQCCAAVSHQTKAKSYSDLIRGTPVYIRKKLTNGKVNIYESYSQCSKSPTKEGCTMCHIHSKMGPDKIVRMEDLADAERATSIHEYYGDMGVRGAKSTKKDPVKISTEVIQTNLSLPTFISKIISSGNKHLINQLEEHAEKLICHLMMNVSPSQPTLTKPVINSVPVLKTVVEDEHEEDNVKIDLTEEDNVEIDLTETSNQEEENNENNNNEEDDALDCVEISTITGREFYLDEKSKDVYENINDEFVQVGILREVNERYSQINYKSKKYTVIRNNNNSNGVYTCYITNNKFDEKMNIMK